jgi:hypothetical protein
MAVSQSAFRAQTIIIIIMANIPQLRSVLMHDATRSAWIQALAMVYWPYTTNPGVPYSYYKLVTNVIRAVKINVLSYPWYKVRYTMAVSQSAFRAQTTQFINGYIIYTKDRNANRGDVAMYVQSHIPVMLRDDLMSDNVEII